MVLMDSGQINQVLGVKKKSAIAHADLSSFRKLFDVILTNDRSLIWLVRSQPDPDTFYVVDRLWLIVFLVLTLFLG